MQTRLVWIPNGACLVGKTGINGEKNCHVWNKIGRDLHFSHSIIGLKSHFHRFSISIS
jgi:hypothetical protein